MNAFIRNSFFLIFMLAVLSFGQVSEKLSSEDDLPSVKLVDDVLSLDNLPAISQDGRFVMYKFSPYSCCSFQGEFLNIFDSKMDSVVSIATYPSEEKVSFSTKQKKDIVKEINRYLSKYSFSKMSLLQSRKTVSAADSNLLSILAYWQGDTLESKSFEIPNTNLSSYCCSADENDTSTCVQPYAIVEVFINKERSNLLLELGLHSARDGCDAGPEYKLLKIEKK